MKKKTNFHVISVSMFLVPMDMKCQQTTSSETTTSMLAAALCGGCCGPICDRYIMRVVDTYYHEGCLSCTQCAVRLMHSCFQRNGKLYCRIDYERYVCGVFCDAFVGNSMTVE